MPLGYCPGEDKCKDECDECTIGPSEFDDDITSTISWLLTLDSDKELGLFWKDDIEIWEAEGLNILSATRNELEIEKHNKDRANK